VSGDGDLLRLARERDNQMEAALGAMYLESPAMLGRNLRNYLSRQVDRGRMKHTDEKIPRLLAGGNDEKGLQKLVCNAWEFASDAGLSFEIVGQEQRGWLIRRFEFHLRLPSSRTIRMVRIELNTQSSHDPLKVPRCHFHIGDSEAHIPFPIMDPRLILHLICEHVEPDLARKRHHAGDRKIRRTNSPRQPQGHGLQRRDGEVVCGAAPCQRRLTAQTYNYIQ
jgi:hypothetical protein